MAGKKKVKKVGKVEAEEAPEVTVGEGEEVEAEEAIPEVATIKVRCPKHGVRMMTQTDYDAYVKERNA